LGDAARVLATDFGFRSAVATGDHPTIVSALDNLKQRLNLADATFVSTDGSVVSSGKPLSARAQAQLVNALENGATTGVIRLNGQPASASASPVMAPVRIGWVVFSQSLGAKELRNLASLSNLDLAPRLVSMASLPRDSRLRPDRGGEPVRSPTGERLLARGIAVQSFRADDPQVLILEFSLSKAMAGYQPLYWTLLAAALAGLALAWFGCWRLARRIVQPIRALETAARKIGAGTFGHISIDSADEIGMLAKSFNQMAVDIDERERRITHMAFHDELTGLANRNLLHEHLAVALSRPAKDQVLALICMDLDNFKVVNDTLGHPIGDELLRLVANRLTAAFPTSFISRLGGDEFSMVVEGPKTQLAQTARRIVETVAEPAIVEGHRILPNTSVGIAIGGEDGADETELLKNADLALYRAKQDGKAGYRFFEASMDAEARARRLLELELRDALNGGEFELMFQPLFSLERGKVSAFEALIRWNHPERGVVGPLDFISVAEETGLIVPIGEWVIREACRIASAWPKGVRVAVNVSALQFRSPGLTAVITQALAESGLAPNCLEIEITESLFVENQEATLAMLHSLRAIGVRVALDDFGTGYSSLSYLRSFPFDKIKIDRSFIVDLLSSDQATAIIRSITTLAKALGMETTAEGVENKGQMDLLREQGCSQIQGYYFSRPIPASKVDKMLAEKDTARSRAA